MTRRTVIDLVNSESVDEFSGGPEREDLPAPITLPAFPGKGVAALLEISEEYRERCLTELRRSEASKEVAVMFVRLATV